MTHVVCEIALGKGRWRHCPLFNRVRRKLRRAFGNRLLNVTFHNPGEENAVEVEISVDADEESCDGICDILHRTFLQWRPQYESMIEISFAVD